MALTDNIINYWKLDGNSTDSVGTNNGTDTAISYSAANGIIIQGAGFNGTTSSISVGTIAMPSAGTFSFWIFGQFPGAVSQFIFDSNVTRNFMWNNSTTASDLQVSMNAGTATNIATAILSASAWNYIALTWDGVNGQWYKNGSTFGVSFAFAPGASSATGFDIGSDGSATRNLNSKLDEIGLWTRALSSSEISQLWNGGVGLQYPFTTGGHNLSLLGVGA